MASRRRDVRRYVPLRDLLLRVGRSSSRMIVTTGGRLWVRRRQVNVQHALVVVVVVRLRLRPQEVVQKIKTLRSVGSRGGGRGGARLGADDRLLLRFADTLAVRSASALVVELMSGGHVSLLHVSVRAVRDFLIQSATNLRPAGLTEFPVLSVDVPSHAGHASRIGGGLLVTRRLATRAVQIIPEVLALDHGDAHVMRQRVLNSVWTGAGRCPEQSTERPPLPVLLPGRVRRRDRRPGPLPLVPRRR